MVAEEQEMMNMDKDPLIDLKQQELNLRAQQLQQDRALSEKRLDLDTEKLNFEGQLQQKDEIDKERIQSQEDMADLRAEVTLAGQREKEMQQRINKRLLALLRKKILEYLAQSRRSKKKLQKCLQGAQKYLHL